MPRWSKDYIPDYHFPSVSVYFKVSYDNKDKFKKYGAVWRPDNKEWKIKIRGSDYDSWQPIHDEIMTINKELKICGSKIHAMEEICGYLDEFNTFKLVLGKPREKAEWEKENVDLVPKEDDSNLCPDCGDVKDSAGCFRDCDKCYREKRYLPNNTCVDCNKTIDRNFSRCFKCNAEHTKGGLRHKNNTPTTKIIDLMEKKVNVCLISDD